MHHDAPSRTTPPTRRRGRGFTLIEVVFTLVILGVLVTVLSFNANATARGFNVRSGWLTLGQAQLAGRVSAGANTTSYAFPSLMAGVGCLSELASNSTPAPVATGVTFVYDCASTGMQNVSVSPASSDVQYYTLLLTGGVCLVEVDHLDATAGAATFYGEDAAVTAGHCNAVRVGAVAGVITSTQQLSPTLITGAL